MTQTCQNGYPVLPYGDPMLRKVVIPGANRALILRNDAAGFLLADWAKQYNDRIERLDIGRRLDEGGHNVRRIAGTNVWSNHSGGTAEDFNWDRHPYGADGTYTTTQMRDMHRIMANRYKGCIRAGIDYHNTKDEMHFEIVGTLADCRRRAFILAATPRGRAVLTANPGFWADIRKHKTL